MTRGMAPAKAPPGPRGYPVVGVFPAARRDPLGFFLESARRYGDVVSMQFGLRRVYLLSHPDDVRHVLQDSRRVYGKSPTAARVRPLFGDSLTTVDGEHWRRQRRLIRPAFRPNSLLHCLSVVTATTVQMLDRWQCIAERGETVDMLSEMTDLTRTIIVKLVFGDVGPSEARALDQALQHALRHVDRRLWSPLGGLDIPTPGHRRFQAALRTIDAFVSTMVARAREDVPPAGTLLSALLDSHDDERGERMRDADLCQELKAILVAGHTTTASALAWTLYALSMNSGARESLRAELREVLDGRLPGAGDLSALAYTRMVIDEVLRLYPPTWVTARTPLHDDLVRGYRIAAGSIVLVSPFVTHRHPAFWPEPERFNPERFLPERCRSHSSSLQLRILLGPLHQHLILLLLRQLQVLLAEEPEPWTLRAVLAARIAAAHVSLGAARSPGNSIAAGFRQRGRDSIGEHLREAINQGIEWVRRAFGHMALLLEERMVVQATYSPRWPYHTPRPQESASASRHSWYRLISACNISFSSCRCHFWPAHRINSEETHRGVASNPFSLRLKAQPIRASNACSYSKIWDTSTSDCR